MNKIKASKQSINSRKPILGIGINDADYEVCITINGKQVMCLYYKKWKSMLERCYSKKHHDSRNSSRTRR